MLTLLLNMVTFEALSKYVKQRSSAVRKSTSFELIHFAWDTLHLAVVLKNNTYFHDGRASLFGCIILVAMFTLAIKRCIVAFVGPDLIYYHLFSFSIHSAAT